MEADASTILVGQCNVNKASPHPMLERIEDRMLKDRISKLEVDLAKQSKNKKPKNAACISVDNLAPPSRVMYCSSALTNYRSC